MWPRLRDIRTTLKLLEILACTTTFDRTWCAWTPWACARGALRSGQDHARLGAGLGAAAGAPGEARVALPGGCAIGARPVDLHLKALEAMGAVFDLEDGYIRGTCAGRLRGAHIQFDFPTVGGTENLLMAAALAEGETLLVNSAREPEVVDLANFLVACGAKISGQGTSIIRVEGVERLEGCAYRIMPDRIEAGTFLCAAAITDGELLLADCPLFELEAVAFKLREMGVWIEETAEGVICRRGTELVGVNVTTLPYPGFPTDMQAQIMALMCLAKGTGVVKETIFENRFMHVPELGRMGARISLDRRGARRGGADRRAVMASDLRASASLVLAGLAARGTTHVQRIYHLDRGYERIEEKLRAVGAVIRREQE
jgi:UDP-N-acetylglucosamine 1-carboxyvinyltransferase